MTILSHTQISVHFVSRCCLFSVSACIMVFSVSLCVDVRLNPVLMKSCMSDITKYCPRELDEVKNRKVESEGRVMFCLRRRFAAKVTASLSLSLCLCLSVSVSVSVCVCVSLYVCVCMCVSVSEMYLLAVCLCICL